MSVDPNKVKSVFLKAVEVCEPGSWTEFLEEACEGDNELRRRVEVLLNAHLGEDSLFDEQAGPSPTVESSITEKPGAQIGPYKLLQQLGEGGMGVVYMAEQKEPVKRRVALKIIKPGMDTRQVIARFEAERQALAMMDHPNIAKVLDAGATESGRPYFVMELVNGISITQFCDEQHLTPKERLELFVPICQAVQHAHQKGIIHRDLKPSNILVAEYDHRAVPKIIDFGVAKATTQTLTEETMFTQLGQIVGTLEYMSPEQAKRNQLDVDTRSDIYSLGVVLYELLTGETPFDRERLRSAAFDEMLRIIREEEPSKPSTKVSSSQSLPSIAANRRIEPAKLGSMIRGELDWIVMKAMEKDRGRRYETASEFAADVTHYLRDEPVLACPPSAGYRFRKFAQRNKVIIGTSCVIALTLIAGIAGTTWQACRATAEAERADGEAEKAKTEAAISQAVNAFLNRDLLGMADVQSQAEAGISPDPNLKVRTLLDRAANRLEGRFPDQPLVEAAIRHTLGNTYRSLGTYNEAETHLQRSLQLCAKVLGGEHEETLELESQLAWVYMSMGRFAEAETLHREALDARMRSLGLEHVDTLASMTMLATVLEHWGRCDEAVFLNREALQTAVRKLGLEHPITLLIKSNLANAILRLGRYAEAAKLHREVLETRMRILGPEHPNTIGTLFNLGYVCALLGRYSDAESRFREALDNGKRVSGLEHPQTLRAMMGLAMALGEQGRREECLDLEREVLEIQRRVVGPEHPDTLETMGNLGNTLNSLEKYSEAESVQREALEIKQRVLGAEHPSTLAARLNIAITLHKRLKYTEAEKRYLEVLEIQKRIIGASHPETLTSMKCLAALLRDQAKYAEAEELGREVLRKQIEILGPEHVDTLSTKSNLAVVLQDQGSYEEAKVLFDEVLGIQRRVLGERHPDTLRTHNNLRLLENTTGKKREATEGRIGGATKRRRDDGT